jgi:hypothetical protein
MERPGEDAVDGQANRVLPDGLGGIVSDPSAVEEDTGPGVNADRYRHSFFEQAMRIVAPDYLPNEMDVLRARTKTTGIYETRFEMGQLSIQ